MAAGVEVRWLMPAAPRRPLQMADGANDEVQVRTQKEWCARSRAKSQSPARQSPISCSAWPPAAHLHSAYNELARLHHAEGADFFWWQVVTHRTSD